MSTYRPIEILVTDHIGQQTFSRDLLQYIIDHNNTSIKALLSEISEKPDISSTVDSFGRTLLHYAVEYNNEAMARSLIDSGCNIHAVDKCGQTPLLIGLAKRNIEALIVLAGQMSEVYIDEEIGKGCLRIILADAEWSQRTSEVLFPKMKIKSDDSTELASILTAEKCSLRYAIYMGNVAVTKEMIDQGCSIEANDVKGNTALYYAVHSGHFENVKLLLERGADPNSQNMNGDTALHLAVGLKYPENVKVLLENGANVDIENVNCETALHVAVYSGQTENVKLLLASGADVNVQNKKGEMPIYYATNLNLTVDDQHREILKLLVEHGSDLDQLDNRYQMQICQVLQNGPKEAVEILLDSDRVFLVRDGFQKTVVHHLAKNRNPGVFELLIPRDIDPNVRDTAGRSPLHCAAKARNEIACKILLDKGANVNAMSMTPLRIPLFYVIKYMKASDDTNCLELLLERGANVQFFNRPGLTLFTKFQKQMVPKIAEIILGHVAMLESVVGMTIAEPIRKHIEAKEPYRVHYKHCIDQLEKMKTYRIYGNITFIELLNGDEKKVTGYMRNDQLIRKIQLFRSHYHLNCYCNKQFQQRISYTIQIARLTKQAAGVLFNHINSIVSFNFDIVYEIITYLHRQDLLNIINTTLD